MNKEMTPEVEQIGRMHFEGNIIPSTWFSQITFENGKADLISITLLSEILYWYRPTYIKDELTGALVEVRRKFKGNALQKSKKALAEQFGLTERQVKDSLGRLEKIGLIKRDFRVVQTEMGPVANVQFILIIPSKIEEITYPKSPKEGGGTTSERHTTHERTSTPNTSKRTTYTENTTKTTTKIKTPPNPLKGEDAKASVVFGKFVKLSPSEYDKLCLDHGKPTIDGLIDELNDYCAASKPKGYNDYAAAIRQWLRRRKQAPTQNESARTKLQQEDDKRELAAKNRPIGAEAATHFHKQAIKKGISINLTHDFIQIGVDKIYFNDIKFLELLKHTTQKFGMT